MGEVIQWFSAIFYFLLAGVLLWGAGRFLGKKEPANLRLVWLTFWLAAVATFIALYVANKLQAFDQGGKPTGVLGQTIVDVFNACGQLSDEGWLLLGGLALVVCPQVLSYLTCGILYRQAPKNLVFGVPFKFALIYYFKSVVGFCGMVTVLFPAASLYGWVRQRPDQIVYMVAMTLSIVAGTLGVFAVYAYRPEIFQAALRFVPLWFQQSLHRIHVKFTENEPPYDEKAALKEKIERVLRVADLVTDIDVT